MNQCVIMSLPFYRVIREKKERQHTQHQHHFDYPFDSVPHRCPADVGTQCPLGVLPPAVDWAWSS